MVTCKAKYLIMYPKESVKVFLTVFFSLFKNKLSYNKGNNAFRVLFIKFPVCVLYPCSGSGRAWYPFLSTLPSSEEEWEPLGVPFLLSLSSWRKGAPAAFPRSEHCALKVLNSPCWPQAKPAISNPTLPLIKLILWSHLAQFLVFLLTKPWNKRRVTGKTHIPSLILKIQWWET